MLLESLRKQVLAANQEIARRGLAPHTFGNASGVDRAGDKPLVVIKPSGVDYATLKPEDLVITDLDGKIVEGRLRPVTEPLTAEEVATGYVRNTGAVIVRRFRAEGLNPVAVPGVLVAGHAPFAWGKDPADAVEHADVLEYIARLAFRTVALNGSACAIPTHVSEHHYHRKHGPKATYGQR
jgi:L-ribulose-5-phosphate 4-epimerase